MVGIIQSTNEAVQELVSNTSPVVFTDTDLRTPSANCFNGWLNHNQGEAQYTLLAGGIYLIDFNANVSSATPGQVGIGLMVDGVLSKGTEMDATVATANEPHNISFSKALRVCGRGNVVLTINSLESILIDGSPVETQIPKLKNSKFRITRLPQNFII